MCGLNWMQVGCDPPDQLEVVVEDELKRMLDQVYARADAIMADPVQLTKLPFQLSDGGFRSRTPSLRERVVEQAAKEILGDEWFWEIIRAFGDLPVLVIKGRCTEPDPDPRPIDPEFR